MDARRPSLEELDLEDLVQSVSLRDQYLFSFSVHNDFSLQTAWYTLEVAQRISTNGPSCPEIKAGGGTVCCRIS